MDVNGLSGGGYEDIATFTLSEMLDREIEAAGRGAYPFTLALVSVSPKKRAVSKKSDGCENDKIANTLKSIINSRFRSTDTCFFIGSGRLVIILPFTCTDAISGVEEKIRTLFSSHTVTADFAKTHDIMISSVQYPEDGKNKDNLMKKLDV